MADFDEITSMLDDLVTSFEQLPVPTQTSNQQKQNVDPPKTEAPKPLANIPSYDSFLVSEQNTKKSDQEAKVVAQPIKVVAVPTSPPPSHILPNIADIDDDLPPPIKPVASVKSSTAPVSEKTSVEEHAKVPNNNAPQTNILPHFDTLDDIPPPSPLVKPVITPQQNTRPPVNHQESIIPQNREEIHPTSTPYQPVSPPPEPAEIFVIQERHRTPTNTQQVPPQPEVVPTPPPEQQPSTKKYVPPSKAGTIKVKSEEPVKVDPSFALLDDIPPPTAKTGTIKSVVSPILDPSLLDDIPPPLKHSQSSPRSGYSTVGHTAAPPPQPAPAPQPTNSHYATTAPGSKQRQPVQGLFHSTSQPTVVQTQTQSAAANEPLWKEFVSATTGKKYYFNTLTKETTWNVPQGAETKPKVQAQTLQQLQEQMLQHQQEQAKVTTPRSRSASSATEFVGPQINYDTDPQRFPRQLRQPTDGVKQFYATVELIDNSKKKIKVSEDFLVWDLMEIIAEKLDVWQVEYFALSAVNVDGSDRWLRYNLSLDQERVNEGTKLVLKVKHWLSPKRLVDPQAIRLFYLQAAQNVVSGAWMCPTRLSYTLAALQMFVIYGQYNPTKHKVGFFDQESIKSIVPASIIGNLNSYLPSKEKEKEKDKDQKIQFSFEILQKHIIRLYSHFSNSNIRPLDAMIKYLETCRKIPFYGYTFFDIIEAGTARKLGVGKRGFILSKKENILAFDLYSFYELSGWNQTSLGIQIRISNPDKKPLFDVSSANGYTISELLCEYYALWLQLYNTDANYKPIQPPLNLLYIPDYRMYNREVLAYALYDTNFSRLELLHKTYLENCKTAKVVPKAKILRQLDEYLDFEINKDSSSNPESEVLELDLHGLDLEAVHMDIIAKSIVYTLKYEAKKDNTLIENFKLRSLDLSQNPLGPEAIASIAHILEQTSPTRFNLQVLNLSGTKLGPKGAHEFASCLENNKTIEDLNFSECELGNKGAKIILTAIKRNRNYKLLNLSNNNLEGDKIAAPLSDVFNLNSHFLGLNVSKNKLGDSGLIGVVTAIRKASMKNIEFLDVSDIGCGSSSLKELMIWLSVNSQLKKLNLSYNPISDKIGKRLLKILGDGVNKLAKLDLRACQLPKEFMLELCRLIGSAKRLEEVTLSANRIGKKAAEALSESISANQNLTLLGVRDSQLKKDSMISIFKSLKKHPAIKVVDLAWNEEIASNEVTKDLEDFLIFSRKLEELNIAACALTSASIATIANGLLKNNTLKKLHLDGNKIGKHLPRLAECLLKNPDNKLEVLTLKKTEISKKDLAEFLHVLHEAFSNAGALQNQNSSAVLSTIKLKEVNVQSNELSKEYFAETLANFPDMKVVF